MSLLLRGPFKKFVDSSYSKKRPSPHLHKFPTPTPSWNFVDHATITLPPPLKLGITVTASLCITAAHCRQSKNVSNGSRRITVTQHCSCFRCCTCHAVPLFHTSGRSTVSHTRNHSHLWVILKVQRFKLWI
jgi:hypothetical protein